MTRFLVIAMLGAWLVPAAARAADVQFCVEIEAVFTDASWTEGNNSPDWQLNVLPTPPLPVTEDNWVTKIFERPPRGAKYRVKRNLTQVQAGYLGDGFDPAKPAGCTDNIQGVNLFGSWTIDVFTEGVVQANNVYSYDHAKTSRVMTLYLGFNPPAGRSNPPLTFPQSSDAVTSDVMTGYITSSFALYRHAGGETANRYYVYRCECDSNCISIAPHTTDATSAGCDCVGSPGACTVTGNSTNFAWDGWPVSSMTPKGINRKFTLVHELGHQIAALITNGVASGGDCDDDDGAVCSTTPASSHALWSRERQRCAYKEAFANFYSVDVWNSHSQKDCAYKYWAINANTTQYGIDRNGAVFDCAGDDGADPGSGRDDFTNGQKPETIGVSFLDKCLGPPWAGKATEMDYTRVFWNVHTDGSAPPTFTDVARWIRDCSGIQEENVYTQLEWCADSRDDSLEANWDANKGPHNIDNPAP